MILYEIIYGLFCIFFAGINNEWIQDGKKIKHGLNGLLHASAAGIGWIFWGWPVAVIILCNTRVVFDISLNLFRGLPVDYVPAKPLSIVDKIEKWMFKGNGLLPKLVYLFVSAVCHVIYFV